MIVRQTELKMLENYYEETGNQLVMVYGRYGAQKEELFEQFIKGKKSFYYRAAQASAKKQKMLFGKALEEKYGIRLQSFSYDEFFNRVRSGDASKLVLIIDEFQNIVKKDPEFLNHVMKLKNKRYYPGPVMIILASSSQVWAEHDFNEIRKEINGKFNAVIKLQDLRFLDVVRSFPDYTTSQSVQVYGVIGGVPAYVERWNPKQDIKENICENILSRDGFLFSEAEHYISTELRELSVYNTILASIAAGNTKLNDLFLDTGFSRAKISVYMRNLMEFEVVEKVVSFETGGWENAKKGVYRIKNTFINFWFRFIYPHLSEAYILKPEDFYDRYIAKELEDYLNRYFVGVCSEYLELLNRVNRLPLKIHKLGTWVGKKGNIDIIAQDSARNSIVAICNWSKPELTLKMCGSLMENMKLAKVSSEHFYLFSAKGFEKALVEKAKEDGRFILIDMNDL